MTRIYVTDGHILVSGHANYAPHGTDIVCAGISTLTYTLMECANVELKRESDGEIEVWYKPDRKLTEVIKTGYTLLAESYPDHVKVCDNFPEEKIQ